MSQNEIKKAANVFAQKTFKSLIDNDLMPIPELYELWYTYYAGANVDIARAIDVMTENNEPITHEKCLALHQRYLTEHAQNARVETAGRNIQDTIKNVAGMVADVKSTARDYNETLSDVTTRLSDGLDTTKISEIVVDLVEKTNVMAQKNAAMEDSLEKSMLMMLEMEHDLEAVKKEVFTDSLTNISNRKAFDHELKNMSDAVNAGDEPPFSMLFIDIDKFKDFNDTFGHQVGDQVLKLIARTLVQGVKGRDTATRYGGEEFAILLPDTLADGGLRLADSLREAVAAKEVINRMTGECLARITISGGVAEYQKDEDIYAFVQRADKALYKAKDEGRNIMVKADPPAS